VAGAVNARSLQFARIKNGALSWKSAFGGKAPEPENYGQGYADSDAARRVQRQLVPAALIGQIAVHAAIISAG